jgi:hypothetical protein
LWDTPSRTTYGDRVKDSLSGSIILPFLYDLFNGVVEIRKIINLGSTRISIITSNVLRTSRGVYDEGIGHPLLH